MTSLLSANVENYLGAIYRMGEGQEVVGLSELAERLRVTRVSANEMVRKLEAEGLVSYVPWVWHPKIDITNHRSD